MSRARASVGFSPTRWNGARKMPNFIPRCAMVSPRADGVVVKRLIEFSTDVGRRALTPGAPTIMIGRPIKKERGAGHDHRVRRAPVPREREDARVPPRARR